MNDNDPPYVINETFNYVDTIKVKIEDLDAGTWIDPHDHIGTLSFTKGSSTGTYDVRGDGAHYQVAVEFSGTGAPASEVLSTPWDYSHSPWKKLASAAMEARIRADVASRIATPRLVYQGARSLCGPASLLYEFVRKRQLLYIAGVKEMYERGTLTAGAMTVRPGSQLLESDAPASLAPADWIMVASMRDHENVVFDVEPEDDWGEGIAGLTYVGAMKAWVQHILGYSHVDHETTYAWGEEDALLHGRNAINNGGVAFLLIDSAMLQNRSGWLPNHWIVLRGGIVITRGRPCVWDDDKYAFDYFNPNHNPGPEGRLVVGEGVFEDGMYGCVWGY